MHLIRLLLLAVLTVTVTACAGRIAGVVRIVDGNNQPVEQLSPEGGVVNMINTSAPLDKASHSVILDKSGKFSSAGAALEKGMYKVEVTMPGFVTTTVEVELGKTSDGLVLDLRKIPGGSRRSWRNSDTDADKIVNPGEVNIQPPFM